MTMRTALRLVRGANEPPDGTDSELLRRFTESGDEAAFAAVFDRHAGMVLGVCKRALADPRDAEDACQATFLVLARKARTGRWHTSVANWLHATARRVARNVRVTSARRVRREAAAAVPEAVPAVDRMSARELLEALDDELARLPARYREPLVLCHLEGLTRDQAARRLGLRPGTVKIRLERGRRRLAAALTARGTTPVPSCSRRPSLRPRRPRSRLSGPTLAAVGGRPSATVAALADGVSSTGTVFGLAGLAFGIIVIALGLLLGSVNGSNPAPDLPKKAEPAAPVAAATDAFGDPLPPGAVARLGTVRFRFGMWPWYVVPSPDGSKLATFGANGQHVESMTISDATSGRPLRTVALAGARVQSAQWLPDGRGFAVLQTNTTDYAVWEFTDEKAAPPTYTGLKEMRAITNGIFVASTVSPNGKLVAGASQAGDEGTAGRLEVWALVPGGKVRAAAARHTIDTPDGFVWLGFTPDSKRLVGVTRHREPNRPGAAAGPGQPVPVVPGAKADTARVVVWDAATGKELLAIKTPGGLTRAYAIAPDGATLFAAGEKGRVAAFDLATEKERFVVDAGPPEQKDDPARYVSHLVVAAGGRTLLLVENMQAVAALDAATGKSLWRNTGREAKQVYALAALPDGKRFVIGCVDGTIVFGDAATGKVIDPGPGHRGGVRAVALDGAGRVAVTSGSDATFRRWELASGREAGTVEITGLVGFHANAFSPDRRTAVGTGWQDNKGVVVLADVATGRTLTRLKGDTHSLFEATMFGGQPAAWVPDGSVILTDADCGVRFGPDGKEVRTYSTKEINAGSDAYSVAVSRDGRRVALVGRGPRGVHPVTGWVAVFDAATGKLIRAAQTPQTLASVAFAPDGTVLVSGSVYPPSQRLGVPPAEAGTAAAVGLFDPSGGKMHYPFADPTDGTTFRQAAVLCVSPTGYQIAVAEHDDSITVYERASGAVRRRLRGHVNQVYQLAFTPDGARLVSVSWDGTGLVWDAAPPRPATPPVATDAERLKWWEGLLAADGPTAHRTMGELAADPAGTVSLLKAKLNSKPPTDAEIDKPISGLGAEAFADREAASRALERFGAAAVPRVKARLSGVESAEVRRRLGEFLARHDRPDRLTGTRLRERRAVELLEVMATADARSLLDELARSGSHPLAEDAATAAARLRAR
ncbi:sigma-70 family RNA polymerase sigma factor [Frigoriglobus tundricola]|uniref:ECF RNA polymerase sigma factor SigE n=1 Tax=Frigoriglobus tundricola TaxID=2774151 RepID=A0A6M5YL68_9BACT|nr:sigma-70 family RNA polymerase sigma factor [Frigoriglobus tundricola]QJW94036.1 hypothetical protein FTUN_1555 [Frigoriglobus tundricola]